MPGIVNSLKRLLDSDGRNNRLVENSSHEIEGGVSADFNVPALFLEADAEFPPPAQPHTSALAFSLEFLRLVLRARLKQYFGKSKTFEQPPFTFPDDGSYFADYVIAQKLTLEEFILVLLAMAPHAHPDLFGGVISEYLPKGGDFPEFGGIKGTNNRGLLPTGDTALFLLAGMQLDLRFVLQRDLLSPNNHLFKTGVLSLHPAADHEPLMSGRLALSKEYISLFLTGETWKPGFSSIFPAKLLTTDMEWDTDLVLPDSSLKDLTQIDYWLSERLRLAEDPQLGRKIKPGYRALFYGPPGTGKTLTASLLGKKHKLDVYRIDLSQVVSKYIGETEKNLQDVFNTASQKNWILFFDEADALFGKRTAVSSSHDRYANQEVAYLLQRVEDHDGLVILASNLKSNLDQAFLRRFQSVVYFPLPDVQQRKTLWGKSLPLSIELSPEISVDDLAKQFEMSGAAILNVAHAAALRALAEKRSIRRSDLTDFIRKEFQKEGRTI